MMKTFGSLLWLILFCVLIQAQNEHFFSIDDEYHLNLVRIKRNLSIAHQDVYQSGFSLTSIQFVTKRKGSNLLCRAHFKQKPLSFDYSIRLGAIIHSNKLNILTLIDYTQVNFLEEYKIKRVNSIGALQYSWDNTIVNFETEYSKDIQTYAFLYAYRYRENLMFGPDLRLLMAEQVDSDVRLMFAFKLNESSEMIAKLSMRSTQSELTYF